MDVLIAVLVGLAIGGAMGIAVAVLLDACWNLFCE